MFTNSDVCFFSANGALRNISGRRLFRGIGGSSLDDEDTEVEDFLSPSARWPAAPPKSYRGPRREPIAVPNRRNVRRVGGSILYLYSYLIQFLV